jgi:hypothetical protein
MKLRRNVGAFLAAVSLSSAAAIIPSSPALAETPGRGYVKWIGETKLNVSFPPQWLNAGNSWFFGRVVLTMQNDGNLVMYRRRDRKVMWETKTHGSGANRMRFQEDGNLVLYAGHNRVVWKSETDYKCFSGASEPVLALQSDSNFVIYCAYTRPGVADADAKLKPIWSTGTFGA